MFRKLIKSQRIPTVEQWSLHNAKRATPDGIIAAALVEKMVKDKISVSYTDAKRVNNRQKPEKKPVKTLKFVSDSETITLGLQFEGWRKGGSVDRDGISPWWWHPAGFIVNAFLNGKPFPISEAKWVFKQYTTWVAQLEKTQQVARQAEENMKLNEERWNLAERLLGMKRNEFGALVPIVTMEGHEDCVDCGTKDKMCRVHQFKEKHNAENTAEESAASAGGPGFGPAVTAFG